MKFSTLILHVTPHRRTLVLIALFLLLGGMISLANPWIAGQLTQNIVDPASSRFSLRVILLGWTVLLLLRALLGFASQYLLGTTGQEMTAVLRNRVYEHLQSLPMSYYQQRKPGDMLSLLANDAEIVSNFVTGSLVQLLPQLFVFAGAFVMMAWINLQIALLAAVLLPIYFIVMKLLGRRIRPFTTRWIEAWSNMYAFAQDNLALIPVIKAFGREPLERSRFQNHNLAVLGYSRQQIRLQSLLSPAIQLLAGLGVLLLLTLGLAHMESGKLSPSELVSLLLYAILLAQPLSALANVYGQTMLTRGAAERLLELFAVQAEPVSIGLPALTVESGRIEFRKVSFAYPGRDPILTDFSLTVQAGEIIALTGPNGAGKSTLAHLLLRFIEPQSGCILIDGQDISQTDIASLRKQVGMVAQNTLLLNGSAAENICYGQPQATETDMKKAAKAARANEFIEQLPEGYASLIGDQGLTLSGGQRQRLSLARTLLRDPRILILDEATAMIDPEGEVEFVKECKNALTNRTVILITHRPASLALASRVIKLGI